MLLLDVKLFVETALLLEHRSAMIVTQIMETVALLHAPSKQLTSVQEQPAVAIPVCNIVLTVLTALHVLPAIHSQHGTQLQKPVNLIVLMS